MSTNPKIIRLPEVIEKTGISKTTIRNLERSKNFPSRLKISKRSVGWYEHEIDEWVTNLKSNMLNAEYGPDKNLKPYQLWSAE